MAAHILMVSLAANPTTAWGLAFLSLADRVSIRFLSHVKTRPKSNVLENHSSDVQSDAQSVHFCSLNCDYEIILGGKRLVDNPNRL